MNSVNSYKSYINPMGGSSFQIITFIGLTASQEEKAFPITCRPILYVRYVRLTKVKPIHETQTHPLEREDDS
jgi:hypothetical protein